MNFKESYKQANENIKPDEEFISTLAQQMKQEQKNVRNRKRFLVSAGGLAAAAAVCFAIVQVITPIHLGTQDVGTKAEQVGTTETGQGFGSGAWYGEAETAEEKMVVFQELLKEKKVKTLYGSDTDVYAEDDILSDKETKQMVKRLQTAEPTKEEVQGTCSYFMIVFEEGYIVKFETYGDEYLKLKDSEMYYRY